MAPPLQQLTHWFCALPQGHRQVLTDTLSGVFTELNHCPTPLKEQRLVELLTQQTSNINLFALILNLRTHIEHTFTSQTDPLPKLTTAQDLLFYSRAQDANMLRKIADEQWHWQQSRDSWLKLKQEYLSLQYVRRWLHTN
ncbi:MULTISPECIES: hypothetical protein [unclassified Pseudoalteromonas]|uniref:hypothetical protein n=1 Tax=unclassified Pseudoalteromonas TaxID=194690 RepID=UPI0020972AC5|nr:hypothetical protein [Pseudoalteromonas sp. XMcav2-N]MCO7191040.1 hypothetical protein [Pseudoalteromonas sp. XMcav2-N]